MFIDREQVSDLDSGEIRRLTGYVNSMLGTLQEMKEASLEEDNEEQDKKLADYLLPVAG